jgi:hypothetical protein
MGFFVVAAIVSSGVSLASADIGRPLEIAIDPASGKSSLGVHFAYDPGLMGEKFNLSWSLLFGTTLSQPELSSLPAQLKWNLYEHKSQKYLLSWASQPSVGRETLRLGTVGVEGEAAKVAIGSQTTLSLVFGDASGKAFFHLNVGHLCRTLPTYFKNLTDSNKSCAQVTVAEIEVAQRVFCEEELQDLQDYLKQGLITCAVAQSTYAKTGCGELRCN